MKKILGISAFYHDSAAAIVVDGVIIAAAQEERFTRKKHTEAFPLNAIKYCLEEAGLAIDELDAVVFYDKPFLKFERLLETYYAFAPRGLRQFVVSMPLWLKEKFFLKKLLLKGFSEIEHFDREKIKLLFSEHHMSHAASAFYPSPFNEAAILTVDGVGEWATATIGIGKGNSIKMLKEMRFPHSVGLLYSAFTYYLGFKVNSGEYKLMGLAPYGNAASAETSHFIQLIKEHLVKIKDDGSIWINQSYFRYATGLKMIHEAKWKKLFGFDAVAPGTAHEQKHCNLASAIQQVTEEIVIKMAAEAKRITGCDNLCMAGGVALNCVANSKLLKEQLFKDIYIQPAAGDAGGALGAAQTAYYTYFEQPRKPAAGSDAMQGSYVGPAYSDKEAITAFKKHKAVFSKIDSFAELCNTTAGLLSEGKVIGWFQGRMEFGPRALGNRSIIADARNTEMQQTLNLKIKFREGFRPFAPAVLAEKAAHFFELDRPSPYMLFVAAVKEAHRKPLPENYNEMMLWDKLYCNRSTVQAITHVDFTARLQTVHKETNARYWQLIDAFEKITGYPLLVNTSFNVRGQPIVCTPEDAYICFMRTGMDYLVINNFILDKQQQPGWNNSEKWIQQFTAD